MIRLHPMDGPLFSFPPKHGRGLLHAKATVGHGRVTLLPVAHKKGEVHFAFSSQPQTSSVVSLIGPAKSTMVYSTHDLISR